MKVTGGKGGNINQFADKHKVALSTTQTLTQVLRLHAQFPFGTDDLRILFDVSDVNRNVAERLQDIHKQHDDYLELTSRVLDFFDQNQRQSESLESIDSNSLYWYIKATAQHSGMIVPTIEQIEDVLDLFSSPVLDILSRMETTYILTVSPSAARSRLDALVRMLIGE